MTRITSFFKRNFTNLLLSVGAILLTLLIIEVGYSVYRFIRSSKAYFRIDQKTQERYLIPGVVCKKQFVENGKEITIQINSLGWRDREIPFEKQEGTFRIVALGDSITFGWGVELNETYVKQLETILRTQHPNRNYEVINIGIEDLGLQEELKLLKQVGLNFQPDLVLLGFYLNDARPIGGFPNESKPTWFHRRYTFRQIANLVPLTKVIAKKVLIKFGVMKPNASSRFRWINTFAKREWVTNQGEMRQLIESADLDWGVAWKPESWIAINRYIQEMQEVTQSAGCPLAVVCFPVSVQVESDFLSADEPQQHLSTICQSRSIPFLNLLLSFRHWNTMVGELLFFDLCHPKPLAHKKVAKVISEFLNTEGLLLTPR
ncbi:TPA: SGNH/GDSL hydrolase family protein [Candidatus Poribacteria bacterium]|nr:SGNH/GDSL hydrolase family protein [Candidatus Poribacteria bacterium]HIC02070.1 SGNH/GDSL hydrolase family protein [Candidatus Poribacteria bacterium]HIC16527.1 SGNH/GDSL hydrolase family protein [Candidatus Poribacteria bacterium]HIN27632.1 SGNH/GDSL hydrolase family protein [Candidatus Poribacteria bacterium]HIO49402.1 SGNH/GDSL hydrolase family protein [Candidatus Poribacteria bacterium]